jgi:hypothetical protein|tara:strand:+ start:1451 stop:1654 length:204 start_codon:yes stop_codon:yes gene_type:complete
MIKLSPGDLLIEKDGSCAVLIECERSLGVGAWRVFWSDGKMDIFPWVENSIKGDILDGNIKHIKGGN